MENNCSQIQGEYRVLPAQEFTLINAAYVARELTETEK